MIGREAAPAEAGLAAAWRGLREVVAGSADLAARLADLLAPFDRPAERALPRWLAQAQALREWEALDEELTRPRRDSSRDAALAQDCERVRGRIAKRAANAAFPSRFFRHMRIDAKLFAEAADLLEQCEAKFAGGGEGRPHLDGEAVRKGCEAAREEVRTLRKGRPEWVPGLLAELPPEFTLTPPEETGAAPKGWPDDIRDRLAAACWVVDREYGSWAELRPWFAHLLGPVAEVQLWLDDEAERRSAAAWDKVLDETLDAPRLDRPALLARCPKTDKNWKVVRKGEMTVPPQVPEAAKRLRSLARAVKADPELQALCREAADGWPPQRPVDEKEKERLWLLMQRLYLLCIDEPDKQGPATLVLDALKKEGFELNRPVDPPADEAEWHVYLKDGGSRATLRPGPVLRTPDTSYAPAVWIRLAPGSEARPLVRLLREELLRLRLPPFASDPLVKHFEAATADARGTPADDAARCKCLFEACYFRYLEVATRPEAAAYRDLARRAYHCLTAELKLESTPPLNDALEPNLDGATPRAVSAGDQPLGSTWVVRFGDKRTPAEVAVRVGEDLADWLRLPDPPGGLGKAVLKWVRGHLSNPRGFAKAAEEKRSKFADFLRQPGNEKSFDELARTAWKGEPKERTDARLWLEALIDQRWCIGCFPRPGEQGAVWPAVPPPPRVVGRWDGAPFGTVLEATRFSDRPENAECVVSLGKEADWPEYARAEKPAQALKEVGPAKAAADALLRTLFEHRLAGTKPSPRLPDLFEAVLGAVEAANLGLDALEPLLKPLAEVGTSLGAQVWPASRADCVPGALHVPLQVFWRFSSAPRREIAGVRFAVHWADGRKNREGRLIVSAGKAPDGYDELRRRLKENGLKDLMPEWVVAMDPEGDTSAEGERLDKGWQEMTGSLFDKLRDHPAFDAVEVELNRLVCGVGLDFFSPEPGERCDPNWPKVDETGRPDESASGIVKRTHRRGLLRSDGSTLLAPVVIVRRVS